MSSVCENYSEKMESARSIQIMAPVNHSFELELEQLKSVLLNKEIKDRHVVVVSIAGALRKGKSFLLNFFLRYLYAQYKKHDTTDWIGKNDKNHKLSGFKSRGGQKPETTGIWMWSDIFTYDFDNGDQIAIVLLDTQGIFDRSCSVKECTTIFALSMLMSSVQCFNLMQNIQEDDLQHLDLFSEYGRLVQGQSQQPFQKLIFIVRDWPYAQETGYGWNGQNEIDSILAENDDQTPEMQQLRRHIKSNFQEISAFLMPYPGKEVAQGNNFTGKLRQIDPEFVAYVKELVPEIFAPENLCVKKINGQLVRACDLVEYLQRYTSVFSGDAIPEPKAILLATADTSNLILHNSCLNYYNDSMQSSIERADPYFTEKALSSIHHEIKTEVISLFLEKPKLGGDELSISFQHRLENDTEERFQFFKSENEMKRKSFIERANSHNDKIRKNISTTSGRRIAKVVATDLNLTLSNMQSSFENIRMLALEQFNNSKMGENEHSDNYREILNCDLEKIEYTLLKTWASYDRCIKKYEGAMKKSFDGNTPYFSEANLMKLHRNSKHKILTQFLEELKTIDDDELNISFQHRIEKEIEAKFKSFECENEQMQSNYKETADLHNKNLYQEILDNFEQKMRTGIGNSCLDEHRFIALFLENKLDALKEFDSGKMCDGEVSQNLRRDLEREIDELRRGFLEFNNSNRSNILTYVGGFTGGASCGVSIGKFFGPEGMVAGAVIGGVAGTIISGAILLVRKATKAN